MKAGCSWSNPLRISPRLRCLSVFRLEPRSSQGAGMDADDLFLGQSNGNLDAHSSLSPMVFLDHDTPLAGSIFSHVLTPVSDRATIAPTLPEAKNRPRAAFVYTTLTIFLRLTCPLNPVLRCSLKETVPSIIE